MKMRALNWRSFTPRVFASIYCCRNDHKFGTRFMDVYGKSDKNAWKAYGYDDETPLIVSFTKKYGDKSMISVYNAANTDVYETYDALDLPKNDAVVFTDNQNLVLSLLSCGWSHAFYDKEFIEFVSDNRELIYLHTNPVTAMKNRTFVKPDTKDGLRE